MNKKVEIWKRKLAKEKWKYQKAVWDNISKPYVKPYLVKNSHDAEWNQKVNTMVDQITKKIDSSELNSLRNFINKYLR